MKELTPKKHETGSAGLVFLITFFGILITLFTGEGVSDFSDISQVQYAVAVMTGFMAAAKDIQSQRKDTSNV